MADPSLLEMEDLLHDVHVNLVSPPSGELFFAAPA
jgi:hypothetical protein